MSPGVRSGGETFGARGPVRVSLKLQMGDHSRVSAGSAARLLGLIHKKTSARAVGETLEKQAFAADSCLRFRMK